MANNPLQKLKTMVVRVPSEKEKPSNNKGKFRRTMKLKGDPTLLPKPDTTVVKKGPKKYRTNIQK